MKKLLFIFLLLPTIVFGQAQPQQGKTPASGTNAGNQYFSWYSGAFNGYFIPPYGSNATLNRAADINGLFYVQLSDSTIRFRYNGSWIPIGKGGSSGAVYFSSTYFGGLGTVGSPITIIPSSVLPSQTGQSGKFLTTNGTTTSWSSTAGGSTGVNGLNGTTNIGLGGTLTGLTYIQNGGYIFKLDSLQILNNPVNGYNAVNLNYLNSKAIYFASGTFTGSGTVGSPYALNVSTSPSSGSTLPVTSGGVYTALGNYVTIAAPQLTTSSTTNYVWTATDGSGHGSWQVASGGFTNPMTTLGDIIYGAASGTATRLAGNSTTTTKFLTSTGSGSAATAPSYFDLFNTANTWGAAQTISTSSGLGTKTQLIFTDGTTGYFNSGTNGFSITESTLRIGYAASTDTYPSGNYPFLQINSNPVASPQFHFSTGTSLSNIGYQFFDGGGTIDFNFSTATTASITAQGGYNLALGKSSSETSTVTAAMTVLFNTTNDIIFGPSPVDAPTALVKIQSTTQGFLTPVMTENQRNLIATITSLTIQLPGTGYTNGTYTLAFSGGGGSGAAGTCTVSGGSITSYNLTNGGKGYTSVPTVSITGGSFTANSITANIAMVSSSNALLVYNSTTSKFNYFDYSTTQWRPLLDSARGGGGGSGTVTSITPGWSFTSTTPITTSGTLTEDSTKVQTVANFFPKGDTRYLKSSTVSGLANPTGTIGFTAVNGSATTGIRSDGAPKADSTVIRSVANSYSLSAMQTKLNNYLTTATATSTYVPYSGATGNVNLGTNSISAGTFTVGTLGYSDTNILGSFQSSVNTYNQLIIQNTNSGSTASADVVVNNNNSTASTYYGDFGMNSSGFTGSQVFNQPNYVFLTATTGDLALGTTTSNAIHFVVNNGTTDAMTISSGGTVSIPGLSTNGLVKTTGGTGALSIAVAGTDYVGLASANTLTGLNTFSPSISASGNLARGTIFTPTLTAVANNDVLIDGDFNPTIAGVGIISTLGSVTGGSSYTNGTYTAVPLTGGNGSGAQATVVVSGGAVSTVTITTAGTRYVVGDVLSAAAANIGGTGSGFSVPVTALTQTVTGSPIRSTVSNIGSGSGVNYTGSWSDGIFLYNPTPAVSTLSQNSPSIHLGSFGWGTTGGTSQQTDAFIYNQVNTGATPSANLTIGFDVAGTKSNGVYTFGSGGAVLFTSGSLTITRAGQAATAVNSLVLQETTAATSGTPNQWTPTWYNEGAVWNTSGTPASNSFAFGLIGEGTSSANPYSTLYFQTYLGTSTTPTFVNTMSLTTQGQLGLGLTNTNIQAGSQSGSIFNISASTLTDNSTASGTVTNFAVIGEGLTTLAATNASITYTNMYGAFFTQPQTGTNVTGTNKYALGLAYDATHLATFAVSSAGLLTINATSTITITPATTFSTTVSGPTASTLTNTTQLATTAYVINNVLTKRTAQAINATATATAAQMAAGYITSTSAAATTITFQTATAYATGLGAAAGSTADLYIDNTAGANTVTIVLGSGMTGVNSPSLTVSTGASGIALYHFTFSSTSACTVVRLQ